MLLVLPTVNLLLSLIFIELTLQHSGQPSVAIACQSVRLRRSVEYFLFEGDSTQGRAKKFKKLKNFNF